MSRNFGQSAAIAAGLAHSEGARVVVMDCDLQDPPEEIPLLLARAREGYDVVFTARPAPSYGLGRRLGTAAYFKLRNLVSDRPVLRYSAFSMVSRRAVDAVLSSGDRHRSYLATLLSLDFERAAVEVAREERHAGESSYTLRRLSRVAIGNLRFEVAARLRRVLPGAAASHRGRKGERPYQRPAYIVDVEAAAGPGKRVGSQKESEPQRGAMKRVAVVQSNYVPWRGYFDLISSVDEFILLDDVQYTSPDWRNRNRIKTSAGPMWLTISVDGGTGRRVDEVGAADPGWGAAHLRTLTQSYRAAPGFEQCEPWLRELYGDPPRMLTDINRTFLVRICEELEIETPLTRSTDYDAGGRRTERLVELCSQAGADEYVSGPAARAYLDEARFERCRDHRELV